MGGRRRETDWRAGAEGSGQRKGDTFCIPGRRGVGGGGEEEGEGM